MLLRNMHLVFTWILLLAGYSSPAQENVIKGRVTDTKGVIPFVTIILNDLADTSHPQHAWTDSLGYYQFEVLQNRKYLIKATHLGYREFISDTIWIYAGNEPRILDFMLYENAAHLKEVVINSKKKVFETDKGKMTFHVQNSGMTTGQTALDMLKRLPGVSVGQNDQILFRGSPGINVMVNGKMTYLSGNQLINFLTGMSAEDINKIELITTPSAEFDAAGNVGIINIVPRVSLKKGYAIDLRTSVSKGKYWMTNENISASVRTKKLNLYGSYDFNTPHSFYRSSSGNNYHDNGDLLQLGRDNERAYKIQYHTWRAGADWQFATKHNVGISYHGYFDDFRSINNSSVVSRDNSGNPKWHMLSENDIVEPYHYDALALNYKFDIDTLGKKITADANYTSYRNFSDGLMITQNYSANESYLNEHIQRSHQPGFVKITSVKADADLPFKKLVVKSGVKYAEVANDNQYRFDSLYAGNYIEIELMSNDFKYKERIAAVYLSGSRKFNKTNIEAGLRMEYTNADGYTVKQGVVNKWQYTKLFPSLAVEQVINDHNKIDFSLSRRINRPAYTELNPVRWYTDQYFYWSGNPALIPELAWIYLLNYSLQNKYIFSVAYNNSINYINRRLDVDENGVVKTQSDNFGNRRRLDLTASVPIRPRRFWDIQLFAGMNYTSYPISFLSGERDVSLWAATATLQQDFSLPKDFKVNLAAYFISSELRGIYITSPVSFINFGVKKSLLGKRLEAQLTLTDIFNTNRYKASSKTDITNYYYNDKPYSRVIGLSLKYHFGGDLIPSGNKRTEEQERL